MASLIEHCFLFDFRKYFSVWSFREYYELVKWNSQITNLFVNQLLTMDGSFIWVSYLQKIEKSQLVIFLKTIN